jgi:hypothetical protein
VPSITVDVCRDYGPHEGRALLDAVHAALVEAFRIDPANRNLLLRVHRPDRLIGKPSTAPGRGEVAEHPLGGQRAQRACGPDAEPADRTTRITIVCAHGRSVEAKRRLYAGIVAALEPLGIPGACVLVRLIEQPVENFGVRGGQALCDVDLGYRLDV